MARSSLGGTNRVSKETLLDGMLLDLKNIARTARQIEKTENAFAAPYRIPDNPAESALTPHADSVLGKLEDKPADSAAVKTGKAALRARFLAYELSDHFVANLRTDREAISAANKRNPSEVQEGVGKTKRIDELLGQINDVIAGLDAIIFNKHTRVPEKLRALQSASHVERAPHREKKPATPPTPSPTA